MNKYLVSLIIVVTLAGSLVGLKIAQALSGNNIEVQSIDANFASKTALIRFSLGEYEATNKILDNGDTVITSTFVPSGETTMTSITGQAFTSIFGSLIQEQALNMDAVTNATIGVTGVAIAGEDTTVTVVPRPVIDTVNLDELVNLKIQGLDWNTIKTTLQNDAKATINWTAFNIANNTTGINWTAQQCNWGNWLNVKSQGVNWDVWQNSGCQ